MHLRSPSAQVAQHLSRSRKGSDLSDLQQRKTIEVYLIYICSSEELEVYLIYLSGRTLIHTSLYDLLYYTVAEEI